MSRKVRFNSQKAQLPPAISEMVEQVTELMKLDIVQGLSFEQEPDVFLRAGTKKNPSNLGSIVADHLRALPTGSKFGRGDYTKKLPVSELYDSEVRKFSRKYNIDLLSQKSPTNQIKRENTFAYLRSEITDKLRIDNVHENLFDIEADISDLSAPMGSAVGSVIGPSPGTIDPGVARLVGDRLSMAVGAAIYNWNNDDEEDDNNEDEDDIVANGGLKFRLHKVKCLDETNPEWWGDDEISAGGTSVDSSENAEKISEFRVGGNFSDGSSKSYSPPRILKTFSLQSVSYPADFLILLALAEKDGGGLSTFITKLWEAVQEEVAVVMIAVGAAIGAAIGAGVGGTVGTAIGGPLGTIIGVATGLIVGALVGWLISALKDDLFAPEAAALSLPDASSTFENGSLTSQRMTMDFRAHGGHYRVYYSWEIIR